ncbi:hypothetical protein ACFTRD_27290 [Paenibacillus sp. NPDC056933]|uniref:hypothetical protein n=1 Tax=Paenibacillus sp. NPDC056933 TaxID=3345968 RepID=UPI00362CAC7D
MWNTLEQKASSMQSRKLKPSDVPGQNMAEMQAYEPNREQEQVKGEAQARERKQA